MTASDQTDSMKRMIATVRAIHAMCSQRAMGLKLTVWLFLKQGQTVNSVRSEMRELSENH